MDAPERDRDPEHERQPVAERDVHRILTTRPGEQAEQAAEDYRAAAQQEAEQRAETPDAESPESQTEAQAEADLSPEEREAQQAAEQWLRRIPDDPSGLLRRKFLYQYRLRNMQSGATTSGNPW